jgi:hypothetical protein
VITPSSAGLEENWYVEEKDEEKEREEFKEVKGASVRLRLVVGIMKASSVKVISMRKMRFKFGLFAKRMGVASFISRTAH